MQELGLLNSGGGKLEGGDLITVFKFSERFFVKEDNELFSITSEKEKRLQ